MVFILLRSDNVARTNNIIAHQTYLRRYVYMHTNQCYVLWNSRDYGFKLLACLVLYFSLCRSDQANPIRRREATLQ